MLHKLTPYILAGLPLVGSLSACSSDSADQPRPTDRADLNFRVADVASRSTLINGDNLTGHSFSVWGDMVSNDNVGSSAPIKIFDATEVSYSGSAWTYADKQYWYPGNTYSFVALCPSGLVEATYENSGLSFPYVYPESYDQVEDLIVATHSRKYDAGKGLNTVDFRFSHIFSRLNFVATYDNSSPANSGVTINSIALRGVGTASTFATRPQPLASSEPVGTKTDDAGVASGSLWSTPTATGTIFEFNDLDVTLDATAEHSRHEFFPVATDPLMVIPQTLTSDVEVVITYTPSNQAPKEVVSYLLHTAVASHDGRWLPGRSYTYSFKVGADEIIIFNTPEESGWNDSEGANFIII